MVQFLSGYSVVGLERSMSGKFSLLSLARHLGSC